MKGNSLELTIRPGAQWLAQHLLEGKCGAAVVMNPQTGAVYVMASSPGFDPNLIEKENGYAQVQATKSPCAPEPASPLLNRATQGLYPAGLDLQDDHRGGGARRRRLQAGLDVLRPRLLHRVRQAGQERARPVRARVVRHGEPRRGLPALDQRRVLQHREDTRGETDPRGGEEVRVLLAPPLETPANARSASGLYARASSSTRPRARASRASIRAGSPSARRRC